MLYSKKGAAANGISMILSTERSGCKASQAADMLTVLLGKHLQPSPGSPYLIEREPHCFQFTEEPKYVALTGVSRAVKEGEKISGDQYAMLESEKEDCYCCYPTEPVREKMPAGAAAEYWISWKKCWRRDLIPKNP